MSNYIEREIFVLRDVSCVAQPIEYVQGTNAVPILLHLRDFEIPEESTARVYVEWPSTKGEYDEVDIEGNDVHIDVKDTMFSEVGKCYLQICIVNGDDTLVTFKYPVVVKENRVPGITSPSQNKSNFLDEYIQNLDERLMRTDELLQQTIENAQEVEGNTLIVEEKAEIAKQNAIISQSYAVGGTGTRENEDVENAKFYYEQAERIAQGLSGTLLPCGTITFEELSEVQALPGYMYNMSDAFVSDERFLHSGISHGVGANIYMTIDGKWDVLAGSNVLSVNGKTGVVILMAADIQCEDGETVQSKLNKIGTISDLTTGIKDTIIAAINWLNNSLTALSNSLTNLAKRVSTNETAISDLNTNFSTKVSFVDKGLKINGGEVQFSVPTNSAYLMYSQGGANQGVVANLWLVSRRHDESVSIVPIIDTWTVCTISESDNVVTINVSGYAYLYSIIKLI